MKTPKVQKKKNPVRRQIQQQKLSTTPLRVPRTVRSQNLGALTSSRAGKFVPLRIFPVLREDSIRRARASVAIRMQETVEILMNSVSVRVQVYLVPHLALERFDSMHALNLSYAGEPEREGEDPVPFFNSYDRLAYGSEPILETINTPAKPGETINPYQIEAYNVVWNYMAKNRSSKIPLRDEMDNTLAPAFWMHDQFRHITATWEEAYKAGQVALDVAEARMPVKNIGPLDQGYASADMYETDETGLTTGSVSTKLHALQDADNAGFPDIYAELQADGITVSLSNIEAARKSAAFAQIREQYSGHDDDWLIDMLMAGQSVPEQELKQPILLESKTTVMGMAKRYATDGANLTEHVVNGDTGVDLSFAIPPIPCGGTIVIVAEVVPDQIFERREDPLSRITNTTDLPNYQVDELDTQKVDVVLKKQIDADHDTGEGLFGYGPKNFKWNDDTVRVGGRFFRPEVDAPFDDDRNFIWANEKQNPALATDFYVASEVHQGVFVFEDVDTIDYQMAGTALIEGLTVFGDALIESSDNYAKVIEKMPEPIKDVAE